MTDDAATSTGVHGASSAMNSPSLYLGGYSNRMRVTSLNQCVAGQPGNFHKKCCIRKWKAKMFQSCQLFDARFKDKT